MINPFNERRHIQTLFTEGRSRETHRKLRGLSFAKAGAQTALYHGNTVEILSIRVNIEGSVQMEDTMVNIRGKKPIGQLLILLFVLVKHIIQLLMKPWAKDCHISAIRLYCFIFHYCALNSATQSRKKVCTCPGKVSITTKPRFGAVIPLRSRIIENDGLEPGQHQS
jgi:hypothetical protein